MIQDASYIETDHGKHGRKKPPVPVDPEPPQMMEDEASRENSTARSSRKYGFSIVLLEGPLDYRKCL